MMKKFTFRDVCEITGVLYLIWLADQILTFIQGVFL